MSTCAIARGVSGRATASRPGEADVRGDGGQRADDEGDVRVEIDAELGGAAVDVVAVHGARERLVLELLPDRRRLEPGDGATGAHERHRVDETRQLVARVQGPVEEGDARHPGIVGGGEDRVHDPLRYAARQKN